MLPIEKKLLQRVGGVEIVKNIRQSLHELTVDDITMLIEEVTNQKVVSAHRDISTRTGEIVYIFILEKNYQKELESENS